MAIGCLASTIRTDARVQVRMPLVLSFEEACTLPILWCTIRLALADCMLAAKQTILTHAITGGIGLVALEFAQRHDAAVSGSVGRPSKVALLRTLGVCNVVSSRDAHAFVRGAAACFAGRRVHGATCGERL